jgi:hypothetical protein
MRQKLQLIYFVCGYAMPVAGVILTIIFTVMYGSQFGRRAVVISDGVGGTLRTDGPKEQYIAYFWVAAVAQMIFLISNIFGPCSAYTRFHFFWQLAGALIQFVYFVLSLQASGEWPSTAIASNPSWRFLQKRSMLTVIIDILEHHLNGVSYREHNAGFNLDRDMHDQGFNVSISVNATTGFIQGGHRLNCGTWMDKNGL